MNKNQLKAGMVLDANQSASQGPPAGRHARPAGSPALLLEKGSADGWLGLQKVAQRPWSPWSPRKPPGTGGADKAAYKHYFNRAFKPGYLNEGPREDAWDTGLRRGARGSMGVGVGAGAAAGGIVAAPYAAPIAATALRTAKHLPYRAMGGTAIGAEFLGQPLADEITGPAMHEGYEIGDTRLPVSLTGAAERWISQPGERADIDAHMAAGGLDAYGNQRPGATEPPDQQQAKDKFPEPATAPQPDSQMQAGATAAQALPSGTAVPPQDSQVAPAAPPVNPQLQAGAAAAAAQAPPAAPAGQEAAPQAAPAQQMASDVAQMVWDGPVGDDAYLRALQNPMDMEQINALTDAVDGGQIPQERVPRAVQQIIAYNSIDKAMQEANKTGEPIEQALGRIAQQRAQGKFDADDLTRVVPMLERQAAEEDVAKKQQAGDQTANVEQQMEENRQDPSLIDRLGMMWSGMDTGEKIGLVVGVIGSVVALVNALMGGNGMTTIMAGALGLGGLGYAFGGGDMIKKWFGGDEQAAGPKASEESKSTPVPTGEGVSAGGGAEPAIVPNIPGPGPADAPANAADAPANAAAGPEQQTAAGNQALEQMLADGQVSMGEITGNADVLRGMEASKLVPLIQASPPELQNQLKFLSGMAPEALGAAIQWAVQQLGGKLTPEDIYKMLEAYKLSMPQAA